MLPHHHSLLINSLVISNGVASKIFNVSSPPKHYGDMQDYVCNGSIKFKHAMEYNAALEEAKKTRFLHELRSSGTPG